MMKSATAAVQRPALTMIWRRYAPLTKPTISLLVVVTVVPSLLLAARGLPDLMLAAMTLLGTYLASASASVFNHILDADVDHRMARTRGRPVASGQVAPIPALALGTTLGVISLSILCAFANPLTAGIALAANFFYVLIYTMFLKRNTDQNIVIGGAAGSVGPLIGWAAVTGDLAWPAWALFAIIFLWTPPHFWSLAIKYKKDYAVANIPMLPVTRGDAETRKQIFLYTLTLLPPVAALYALGEAGLFYGISAMAATLYFCWKAWVLYRDADNAKAMPVFHYSCLYLFAIFGALTVDRLVAFL
jgi:protoheme IX farnesyltransferase